ncbi:hypothetical protein VNI00_004758 [Paramarasmius palmivorus]|uniref:Uncharacterized protein n=1 Tax=Paramarasmius palmivorus TaxID=297713 RepID=A0AAW0DJJ8_9AGAR
MSHHPCPFDLLIFSRPEPHITDFFDRISRESLAFDRLRIGDSLQTDRDIETFLLSRFREIRAKHHRSMQNIPDLWPGPAVISQLVQRACSQFVYATTVTKYIDSPHALPTKRLDDILSARPAKPSPYAELDLLYLQILRSCHDITAVLQILQLVLGSSPDIPANDPWLIAQILEMDEAMIPVLMIGLHSVLQVPSNPRERIVIFHASFSEFLRDPGRSQEFFVPFRSDDVRMKVYFILGFEGLRSHRTRRLPQSWPGKIALESCVQRAGGQTLYADILLDYLESDPDGRLEAVLSLQPRETSPTAEMDLLCHEILQGCGDVALCILQVVLATSPELQTTPQLVAQVLGIHSDRVTNYLAKLGPIVHIPSTTNGPIRIRHSSISDFLRSPQRAQQFYVAPLILSEIQAGIYLRKAIASVRKKHKLLRSWPGQSAFQSILRKSGGKLLYLETLIRYISDTDNPAERLTKVLDSDQQRSPTAEMDLLCQVILRGCGDVALRILQVVLATSPELPTNTPQFVAQALDIDQNAVTGHLAQLGPIVHIPSAGTNDPIYIRHSSISDFLLSPERAQQFYVAPLSKNQTLVIYLRTMIAGVHTKHELPQSWPGQSALRSILQKSGGHRVYVDTLTRYLTVGIDPDKRLMKVLGSELEQHETSPEFELYTLYRLVLDSCDNFYRIRQLLWLIHEGGPRISIALLSRALNLHVAVVSIILYKLQPVCRVVHDNGKTMVSFRHPSFPDFLLELGHAGCYAIPPSLDEIVKTSLCYHLEKHQLLLSNADVERLVEMARGQQIYVQTLIRYIITKSNPTQDLLDIVNEGRRSFPQSPTNPNHHLDGLYHRVLRTGFPSESRHIVLQILLMAIKYDQEKSASISDCIRKHFRGNEGPLLNIACESLRSIPDFSLDPERPCPVRFHHPSFPEFLLDEKRSKEFYVGPGSLVNEDVERLIQAHGLLISV